MNKMFFCGAAMAAVLFSAGAGEILKSWNFADPEEQKLVEARNKATCTFNAETKTVTLQLPAAKQEWPAVLSFRFPGASFQQGQTIVVKFDVKASSACTLRANIGLAEAPYSHFSAMSYIEAGTDWKSFTIKLKITGKVPGDKQISVPALVAEKANPGTTIEFRNLSVERE